LGSTSDYRIGFNSLRTRSISELDEVMPALWITGVARLVKLKQWWCENKAAETRGLRNFPPAK